VDEKPKRRTVVVDCESTGLTEASIAIEVAWWDLDTDERGSFIPPHSEQWVRDNAHPEALAINGYNERIAGHPQDDGTEVYRLHHALRGQCIAGVNVGRADCAWLYRMFRQAGMAPEPWHYRLGEIGPYAAGVLGLPMEDMPGLANMCVLLGVDPEPEVHSAANGVTVTGLVLRELRVRRARLAEMLAVTV
jgi:DNA polymerase III subunit epsilon